MPVSYDKSIAGDFNGNLDTAQLRTEIIDEIGITKTLEYINTDDDDVGIFFTTALSGPEETLLDGIVSSHIPVPPAAVAVATTGTAGTTATLNIMQTGNRVLTLPDATDTLAAISTSQTLTNKKLNNSNTEFTDNVDETKVMKFDTAGASSSTALTLASAHTGNRVITFPDATDTVICENSTQSLRNKNLQDSSCSFVDQVDETKALNFLLDGANASSIMTLASSHTANRTLTLPDATDTLVGVNSSQTLFNKVLTAPSVGSFILDTNGNELISVIPTANAINEITIANAATGNNPTISATGDNTNIGMTWLSKGTGVHIFDNTTTSAEIRMLDTAGNDYIGLKAAGTTTSYTLTMPATQGNSGEILENDGTGALTWASQADTGGTYFNAYDNTGNVTFTTTPVTVAFDTVTINDGEWSLANGEVTALDTNTYLFIVDVGTSGSTGTGRSGCIAYLELDSGGGYAEIDGTRCSMYNRGNTYGFQNASICTPISVTNGDKFKVSVVRNHGTDTLKTYADSSRISIVKISGPKGAMGPMGANGDITWEGVWVSQNYIENHAVEYLGSAYVCKANTVLNALPTDTTYWDLLAAKGDQGIQGIQGEMGAVGYLDWQGDWASQNYTANQAVFYLGNSFVCILNTTANQDPSDATYWNLFAQQGSVGPAGSGNTVNIFDNGLAVTGSPFEKINFNGITSISQNGGDSTMVDILIGMRHYGALAADPVATPSAGEKYFNTTINHEMFYDASRSKWLSVALMFEGNGINGTTNPGNYYKRFNGMQLTATRGPRVGKGTVVSIGFGGDTVGTFTYEVVVDGVAVATLSSGGASTAYDNTINGDFASGIMVGRNQSGGVSTANLQTTIGYRYRA
jgi:hypothetical protein